MLIYKKITNKALVAGCLLFACCRSIGAADAEPRAQAKQVENLIQKIVDNRELLTSGICQMSGERTVTVPAGSVTRQVSATAAFDTAAGSMLYDLVEDLDPSWEKSRSVTTTFHRSISGKHEGKSFQFSNLSTFPRFWIDLEDRSPPASHHLESRGLDIRAIGFFSNPTSWDDKELHDVVSQFFTVGKVNNIELEELEDSTIVASVIYLDGHLRRRIWIDPNRGYVVTRMVVEYGKMQEDSGEFVVRGHAGGCETQWKLEAGVYVPISYQSSWTATGRNTPNPNDAEQPVATASRTLTLAFTWESVNENVDAETFEYRNFALPAGTRVWDNRDAPARMIEVISDRG